jgi:hypothetical protein
MSVQQAQKKAIAALRQRLAGAASASARSCAMVPSEKRGKGGRLLHRANSERLIRLEPG